VARIGRRFLFQPIAITQSVVIVYGTIVAAMILSGMAITG